MNKAAGFFFLIVALGLVVYFFNSGGASQVNSLISSNASSTISATGTIVTTPTSSPNSPSFTNLFRFIGSLFKIPTATTPNSNYTSGNYYSGSNYSGNNGSNVSNGYGGSGNTGGNTSGQTSSISPYDIPAGFTASQLSPYFHKVRFGGVSSQQLSLYTSGYGQGAANIDITGWNIKTNRGGEYIPQAANLYDPNGVPVLSDIILNANQSQYVNFYSNSAPVNLRLNKCLGYLNQPRQFNPQFPLTCPYIDRSAISSFSGACQNYIQSLGSCQSPDFGSLNFPRNDYQCEQFLTNNLTYKSCIDQHRTDSDFFSNEWRVWMGSSPLDPFHDRVQLLDRNGLLVDFYQY